MRPRSLIMAAGVVLAGTMLPARMALAQGDQEGPTDRDRDRNRDRDRDRGGDDRDRDRGDRDRDRGGPPTVLSVSPRAGIAGSSVTIRGRFPDGAKVLLGGVEVPAQVERRSISFTVPTVPRGSHPLVVRGGGADVTAGEFRVERGDDAPPPPPPGRGGDRYKARWDRGGWELLGEQLVVGQRDRDVITVGRREGQFSKLMVVVEDSDLEMRSMRIVFTNGDVLEPSLKHVFRENDRTRGIDLPGERRAIKQIEFAYGNLAGGGRARVAVWAREEGSRPRPGGGIPTRPPPGGGPHHGAKPIVIDFWPREGAVGTEVTIQGRRFTPQVQIVFGNDVIEPLRRDTNLLTFVVPRHRGRAPIALRGTGWRDMPVGSFQVSGRDGQRERDRWREGRQRAAERWWAERQRRLARSAAEREAAMRAEEERLAREREARRKKRRATLRARWEQRLLAQADVRAELALHAERSARLERMQRLAEAGDYGSLSVRIRLLVEYEDARHQQRMDDLKAAYARR
jgi:hypothetical protein